MVRSIEEGKCYLDRSGRVRGPVYPSYSAYPRCPWPVFTDGEDYWIGRGIRMCMIDKPKKVKSADPGELMREAKTGRRNQGGESCRD